MKLNIGPINYSEYDLKRNIKIPTMLTPLLAEDLGFHIGDGCMSKFLRNDGRTIYQMDYSGNSKKDLDYFQSKFLPRKKMLYNLRGNIKFSSDSNELKVDFYTLAVFEFFHNLGIPIGKKKYVKIPSMIKDGTKNIKIAFLRGLAAADFCVSVKNRKNYIYPTIGFVTISERLRDDVCEILGELGIPFTKYVCVVHDKRFKSPSITYRLDINGRKRLSLWMDKIGFSDKRNLTAVMRF